MKNNSNFVTTATLFPAPLYDKTKSYTTTIANRYGTVDEADIYYPVLSPKSTETLPVALLLQGAAVDKSEYFNFANIVASYGFVVIIPNHFQTVPQLEQPILLPETSQVENVLDFAIAENANKKSPVNNILDTNKLFLMGHSHGGAVGLTAIDGACTPIFCNNDFLVPEQLVGGVFFGANRRNLITKEFLTNNNKEIPTALIQGDLDGVALPESARKTYELIQNPPKALVTVKGTNHYGITNEDNLRDPIRPTLSQNIATETIACWSALFLRATALNDREAYNYVFNTGDRLDTNVDFISEISSVLERNLVTQ